MLGHWKSPSDVALLTTARTGKSGTSNGSKSPAARSYAPCLARLCTARRKNADGPWNTSRGTASRRATPAVHGLHESATRQSGRRGSDRRYASSGAASCHTAS
uniref:Uncharacterized protein n=1 Tax=Arundo donax TaxID=35708 RepID=A0A0A9HMM3_ARUDO